MASNNYTSANITPSSDTFREWVELTNRITYDMEKRVVTTALHDVGGTTIGNSYIDGTFSTDTVKVLTGIQGVTEDLSANAIGANATPGNLNLLTNTVFVNSFASVTSDQNSNVFNIAQGQFVYSSNGALSSGNLIAISTSVDEFESNATNFNVNGTAANFGSTTTKIDGTTLDIDSTTVDVDGTLLDITSTDVNISGSNVTIDSVNVDIDGTAANLDSTTTNINGTTLDINSATVDIDSATEVNVNAPDIDINGALLDINSTTVDIDGTTTDINADDVNISGANSKINSTHLDIHGTTLDINSATNIDGNVTLTANIIVGTANDDFMNVNSKAYLFDILDVAEPANLQKDLTVGGHTTLNGNTVIGDNLAVDELKLNAQVNTAILPTTNGTLSIGNTTHRWDGVFDDLVGDDITANNNLTVTNDAAVNGDTTLGNANTDLVTFNAETSAIVPNANGNNLGVANKRWNLSANSINAANASVFSNTMSVAGDLTASSDVDVSNEANTGTLRVRSTSKLEGFANAVQSIGVGANAHIAGNVYIHHGDSDGVTTISNGNITVGSGSANTAITPESIDTDGTLAVLGAASIANTLAVGNTTVSGFANVIGNMSATSANVSGHTNAATLGATGAVDFDSTLNADGATTLGSTLEVTGTSTLTGDVTAVNNIKAASANVSGHTNAATLGATGAVDFDSTLNVDGLITGGAGLNVTGIANASSAMNIGTNVGSNTTTHFVKGTATVGNAVVNSSTISIGNSGTTTVIKKNTIDVGANVDINTSAFFVKGTTAVGNAVVNSSVIHIGNNDTNTHISKAGIDTDGNIVAAGTGSITGNFTTGGNLKALSANVETTLQANGATDLNGSLDVAGAASLAGTLGVTGLTTLSGNVNTTVANTNTLHVGPGLADRVRISNNTIKVGTTSGAFSEVTTTGITSTGAVAITNTAAFGNTTITGTAAISSTLSAGDTTLASLGVTGAATVGSTLTVSSTTTLNGDVDIGNANTDTVSITGEVDTSIIPTSNTKALGLTDARWVVLANTINTSGAGVIGDTLEVQSLSNSTSTTTGALVVDGGVGIAKSVQIGDDLKVADDVDIDGDLDVGPDLTVRSNSTDTTLTTTTLVANNLTIVDSATLPSDTTLSLSTAVITDLDVTANVEIGKTTDVIFDLGGNPSGNVTVNLVNAHFTDTMVLDNELQVGSFSSGGSGQGTQANSIAVESDNIYARSDLVANFSSDRNLKEQVIKIDTALDKVESISGYEFTWNKQIDDYRIGTKDYGVIAQELEEILPHAVDINNRGYKTVNYNSLIPLLIEAVKELSGRVKELEKGDEVNG